ncbi:MAG: Ig domain-containing protein [Myxococcota bacterium]|jgi:hypothetical protein
MKMFMLIVCAAVMVPAFGCSSAQEGADTGPDGGGDTGADTGPVPVFRIVAQHPPVGPAGVEYSHAFKAVDGVPPYSGWTLVKGVLPNGLSLDAATGKLGGTPSKGGFYYFVIAVSDSTGASAKELFGIRIGDPAVKGDWKRRADEFLSIYEARHIWHGWSLNMFKPDDPGKDYQLSTYGDSSFMGGQCTMAMAYRYAVEKSPEALKTIRTLTDGWLFFQKLTGVPGLTGRGFARLDDPSEAGMKEGPFWPEDPEARKYRGAGEYAADWIWVGDASRDQYTGAVLGNAMAYDLVDDPQVKETTRTFLTALADHVWDNKLWITDPGSRPTQYGDMDGDRWEGIPMPNGQAAVCDLAWFKVAYHVSGEKRFNDYYRKLAIGRKYVDYMRNYQWVYMGYQTKYYNVYMSNENWYHLMRLETDPALVQQYREIYRDTMWLNTKDKDTPNRRGIVEANAVTGPWYMYSTGDRDPVVQWDYLWVLSTFPEAPLRDHRVENSKDPSIEKNPAQPTESLYALPFFRREGDMVVWHRTPYNLDGGWDSGEERTGCDYLLPYWMGRYYGYISADW